ncbi:hypothetical protein [Pseudomonas sp. Pseu.R1]|uniref:hypothetical protein n=1 Tax=Pseudomonas sp. Pseu.R1 TaxID=3379818 RepID=UPI003B92E8AA
MKMTKPGYVMTMQDFDFPQLLDELIHLRHFAVQLDSNQLRAAYERLSDVQRVVGNELERRRAQMAQSE